MPITVRRICEVPRMKFSSVLGILQIQCACCTTQIYKNLYKYYTLHHKKNTIVSALNFNILKTNLSEIASKEVKIYIFKNNFLKIRSCATVRFFCVRGFFLNLSLIYFHAVLNQGSLSKFIYRTLTGLHFRIIVVFLFSR